MPLTKVTYSMIEGSPVNVLDFGAVGDGVTDDTAAVQAAFTACAASGQKLYFPAGTYNASSALTMGSHDLEMEGTLVYTGSAAITFLTVTANSKRILLSIQKQTTDWSNDNLIGVLFTGCFNNVIDLRKVYGFAIGARFGFTAPFAYNTVFPILVAQNRIQLDLNSPTLNEYANQNTFIGSRLAVFTDSSLNSYNRIGVRIGGGYNINNNVFINFSFELNSAAVTGGATAIPILAETSRANKFIGCRCEKGATGAAVVEQNNTYQNEYEFLYTDAGVDYIDYQGAYRNSEISSSRSVELYTSSTLRQVYNTGPVYERANYYDGSSYVSVDGLHTQTSSGSPTPSISTNSITINSDNVSYAGTRALGVFVKVGAARNFYLAIKAKSGNYQYHIACFDAAGNRLTDTSPNHPYIVGTSFIGINYFSTSFGGVYRTGSIATPLRFSITNDNVATIQILISGGSSGVELQSFEIYADGVCDVYSGVENLDRRQKLGTAAPSAGTWQVGDMVWNAAPAAGGTMGWVCTTAGTPGTWKTFGAISA